MRSTEVVGWFCFWVHCDMGEAFGWCLVVLKGAFGWCFWDIGLCFLGIGWRFLDNWVQVTWITGWRLLDVRWCYRDMGWLFLGGYVGVLRCYTRPGSLLAVARADLRYFHILIHRYRLSKWFYIDSYSAVLPFFVCNCLGNPAEPLPIANPFSPPRKC